MQKCATHDSLCFPLICSAWNWQLDVRSRTPEYPGKRTSGSRKHPCSPVQGRQKPLSWRWQKNRSPLAGSTLSLTMAEVNTFFH